ncbi:Uncharacterised protein [Bordetella pertussis]|nr:Uncharacterised protein [Bordetella pertussis]
MRRYSALALLRPGQSAGTGAGVAGACARVSTCAMRLRFQARRCICQTPSAQAPANSAAASAARMIRVAAPRGRRVGAGSRPPAAFCCVGCVKACSVRHARTWASCCY